MYRNSQDKRVLSSADALYQAICTLMKQKSFDDISIKVLCEHAKIGRSTFYRNFDYIDDVFSLKINRIFSDLITCIEAGENGKEIEIFYSYWSNNSEILMVLLEANRWNIYTNELNTKFKLRLDEVEKNFKITQLERAYFLDSMCAHLNSILHTWLTNGRKEKASTLYDLFISTATLFIKIRRMD